MEDTRHHIVGRIAGEPLFSLFRFGSVVFLPFEPVPKVCHKNGTVQAERSIKLLIFLSSA